MSHRLPWIVIADWNLQADEVRQSEWCKRLGGIVIEPGVAMCSQGQARTLDFAVCCSAMRCNVALLVADFQVPWRPYAALRIRLSIPSTPQWAVALRKPKTPKFEAIRKRDMDDGAAAASSGAAGSGGFDEWSWHRCRGFASATTVPEAPGGGPHLARASLAYLACPEGAEQLGKRLALGAQRQRSSMPRATRRSKMRWTS